MHATFASDNYAGAHPEVLAALADVASGHARAYGADPWTTRLGEVVQRHFGQQAVAYAALPALVVQAVHEDETGVANAVNSIARSVGQALGSTVAVTLIAASTDPATGFPQDSAYTGVGLIGALATLVVMGVAVVGMVADRRGGGHRRIDPLTGVEEATARAGEWSPVSGIR